MPTRSARALVSALSLALLVTVSVAAEALPAQDRDTTTSSSTTSTTAGALLPPWLGTTTTTAPPTETTGPPDDPGAGEEQPAEPVPVVPDTVPPRPLDGAAAQQAAQIIRRELSVAEVEAATTTGGYDAAKAVVLELESALDALEDEVATFTAEDRAAVRRVEIARRVFEARAANAIVRGGEDDFTRYLVIDDANDLAVANTLLGSVLAVDQRALAEYSEAKREVTSDLVRVAERLVQRRQELEAARAALVEARRLSVAARFNLAVFAAGSEIAIHGFVFPVGDPHSFGDSFGYPRMVGSQYEHAHQGTDIMAPFGTPLYAAERGIVTRMREVNLGGTTLWVKGESGTYYYYAHLSGFAEGVHDGMVVEAGTVVGFVGDTGNAKGGAPHLHFEIHPDGGPAVNPYPLLKVVDDLRRRMAPEAG